MMPLSRELLFKLLERGEKQRAGLREAAVALTLNDLKEYRNSRTLLDAESFVSDMKEGERHGAVSLQYSDGLIKRVEMVDFSVLAGWLDYTPREALVSEAIRSFSPYRAKIPVLDSVIASWRSMRKVRKTDLDMANDWVDACKARIAAIDLNGRVDIALRAFSHRLFKDTKRLEKLSPMLDVLLQGDVEAEARHSSQVWQEMGLIRDSQPARLAGQVLIRRDRNSGVLDSPYAAFDPGSVLALESQPTAIRTIENQANFHAAARNGHNDPILLIYTAGMPAPSWIAMYERLLAMVTAGTPIQHWGDVDEGGYRIASVLAEAAKRAGHTLKPWLMSPLDVPADARVPAQEGTVSRMVRYAQRAGWPDIAAEIQNTGFTMEQEALLLI